MKTGDRVICIDASNKGDGYIYPPLIKGREYIIYTVDKCSCGRISFDVGLTTEHSIHYCDCNKDINNPSGVHWCNSKRFAKVKEQYKIIHMDIEIEEPSLN